MLFVYDNSNCYRGIWSVSHFFCHSFLSFSPNVFSRLVVYKCLCVSANFNKFEIKIFRFRSEEIVKLSGAYWEPPVWSSWVRDWFTEWTLSYSFSGCFLMQNGSLLGYLFFHSHFATIDWRSETAKELPKLPVFLESFESWR